LPTVRDSYIEHSFYMIMTELGLTVGLCPKSLAGREIADGLKRLILTMHAQKWQFGVIGLE